MAKAKKNAGSNYNSKFQASQTRIDGKGLKGKLKLNGLGKGSVMAPFDTPAQGMNLNSQGQNTDAPRPIKVPNQYQSKKIKFNY